MLQLLVSITKSLATNRDLDEELSIIDRFLLLQGNLPLLNCKLNVLCEVLNGSLDLLLDQVVLTAD